MKNRLITMVLLATMLLVSGCSHSGKHSNDVFEPAAKINEYSIRCPKDVNFYFLDTSDGTITSLTIEGAGSGNCTIGKNSP